MTVEIVNRPLPDSYFALVKSFPLLHIRDGRHLARAQEMIDRLLQKDLDNGEQQYLDALTDLVETYEDEHEPIPDASEADVLRELMRSSGLSQMKLAKKVGISQSTISAVVNGGRSIINTVTAAKPSEYMDTFLVKSRDGVGCLEFFDRIPAECSLPIDTFSVKVTGQDLAAAIQVYGGDAPCLAPLFAEMARQWEGCEVGRGI